MAEAGQSSAMGDLHDMLFQDAFQTAVRYDRYMFSRENKHFSSQFTFATCTNL